MRNFARAAAALFSGALFAAGAANAAPITIDFEDQSAGAVINNQYSGLGLTISAMSNGSTDQAMVFDTANPTGGDSDLAAPFDNPNTPANEGFEPGNVLIISEDGDANDPDDEARGGTLVFDFDGVVDFLDINVFDIDDGELVSFAFFDENDANLAVVNVAGFLITNGGYASFTDLFEIVVGQTYMDFFGGPLAIGRLDVTFTSSGAVDDLMFAEIPIPGALPLLLTGIAGLGFAGRRKRRA